MEIGKVNIKLEENVKLLTIGIAIALIGIFISYAIITNTSRRAEGIRSDIKEEKEKVVLRKDLERLSILKGKSSKYFYRNIDAAKLRDTISPVAKGTEVSILSIQPQSLEKKGIITITPLKVSLRCTYNQLGKFLEKVEALPALTVVNEILIDVGGAGGYTGSIGIRQKEAAKKERVTDINLIIRAYSVD